MRKATSRRNAAASRDNPLWLKLWQDNQTDFHQQNTNLLLQRYWPELNLDNSSRVFVPLCGKSMDLVWLAQQGHTVIGVELSPLAVKDFFIESGLKPSKRRNGAFTEWRHGRIRILCGDFFALTPQHLGQIDHVYDRAALTALPEDIRALYVAHLRELINSETGIFLLTTEDSAKDDSDSALDSELADTALNDTALNATALNGSQDRSSGIDVEVAKLFKGYHINQAHSERANGLLGAKSDMRIRSEHKLYCLSR